MLDARRFLDVHMAHRGSGLLLKFVTGGLGRPLLLLMRLQTVASFATPWGLVDHVLGSTLTLLIGSVARLVKFNCWNLADDVRDSAKGLRRHLMFVTLRSNNERSCGVLGVIRHGADDIFIFNCLPRHVHVAQAHYARVTCVVGVAFNILPLLLI